MEHAFWFLLGGVTLPTVLLTGLVLVASRAIAALSTPDQGPSITTVRAWKKRDEKAKPVFVLSFPAVGSKDPFDRFAKDIDEAIKRKEEGDSVVVVVNSPGGSATSFGYLYARMETLRTHFDVTVCVDQYAASGGYLMSLPAHRIIAAPWSVVGSIGVVAFVPNVREALEHIGVKPREFTAGTFKRTVTNFDDGDVERERHFREKLAALHGQFQRAVTKWRPQVSPDQLNGDHWSGEEALELGLIDELGTSNDLLLRLNETRDLVHIRTPEPVIRRVLGRFGAALVDGILERLFAIYSVR